MTHLASENQTSPPPIANRRIAFVGKLGGMNRREVRELVKRHQGTMVDRVDETVDLIVIGADVILLGDQTELLDDWVAEASAQGRVSIINETQFWQQLGMVEPGLDVDRLYTPAMLAGLLELPVSTIRRWHRRGLITPTRQFNKLPYFDFQEIASARRIATLIASGATPAAIETKLSRLAGLYPKVQRPLSQLSVIVEGRNVLLRQGAGLIEPGGQMRIDFASFDQDVGETGDRWLLSMEDAMEAPKSLEQLATPDEFIDLATRFEDAEDPQSATEVYRAMSLAFGPSPDVCFRIAELLYQQHDLHGARERYFMAVELDESYVEARASLGCVLVELGQKELALSAFDGALQFHPEYPDVHFYMARLLDDMEREVDARPHWQTFLELAARSPWAEEARQRLALEPEPSINE
jgi:tetratricopeptide (TPR) repeat protein